YAINGPFQWLDGKMSGPGVTIRLLIRELVSCHFVFEKSGYYDQVFAIDKTDICRIGLFCLCIEQRGGFRPLDEKDLSVPAACYERAVIENDQAIAAGYFSINH